ncbi:MAG: SH3 domain-containing protein [Oscillospiraceae bacterium]|nr:SH3 domain-containing protein [Oscillospiraceae bacterium]
MKKICASTLTLCLLLSLFLPLSVRAAAPVEYLPGVTGEMTKSSFWTDMMDEPDKIITDREEIERINAAALATKGSNMHDLKNITESFNGPERIALLKKSVEEDAKYYLGWTYNETGKKLEQEDFDVIIENCVDPDATEDMSIRYGVAVNRALLVTFPYEGQILDDPVDYDFDYQALVGIRMNEPVVIFTTSADGAFYHVYTSCCSGWVSAEDVAVCADKEEWLSAWDFPADKRLVFYGDKMYTDYSKTAPETSNRLITMATVLERMDELEPDELVINRLPLHNYAVYLPVRNEDGSYAKTPALINAKESVSEDYLPLTGRNLAKVALVSVGDAYGWGASLYNEDCTSLNRSIFCCFGLDLPRNGNWQWGLAMPKIDTTYMSTEEKLALLDNLPLGTILNFPGHQMMYLGKTEGEYYVVSTVSSIVSPNSGKRQRTRVTQINQLNIKRANGKTWIQATNRIYIPWIYLEESENDGMPAQPWYHAGTAFCIEKGLIDTCEGGYFHPGETALRSTAVEALWRVAGKPEPSEDVVGFSDVESGASYEKASLWAIETGIVNGIDRELMPNDELTREQLAVILYRFFGGESTESEELAEFEDAADVGKWAREAMEWAVCSGLMTGRDGRRIEPKSGITRAELAVVLQRACELTADKPE